MRYAALLVACGFLPGCGWIDYQVRPGADSVLTGFFYQPTPLEAAKMAIDPYDANNRYRGTLLLANAPFSGETVYLKLFEDNIKDADASVRTAAARALANHGQQRHVPLLIEAMSDPDRPVRFEAARGLQRLHDPRAVNALTAALREETEPSADVRAEAAHALGQYAMPRVVDALIAALDDRSLTVNRAALSSLKTLTGEDHGLDRLEWLAWTSETGDMFAGRTQYVYPVFSRTRYWIEYLPFIPPPPNETPASPAGMPRLAESPSS